jgi:hypothetical protein
MKKKILSILLAIAIMLTAIPIVSANTTVRKGDINGDNYITILDALEILKYLAGLDNMLSDPRALAAAKAINGGDTVTINCVLEILKVLANLPSAFDVNPRPFSFTLPAGWEHEYDTIFGGYAAASPDGESLMFVNGVTLREMFKDIPIQMNFDVIGLNLEQIASLRGNTTEELIYDIIQEIISEFEDGFYGGIVTINTATLNNRIAVRMVESTHEEDVFLYFVFDNYGFYAINGFGSASDAVIQTFTIN